MKKYIKPQFGEIMFDTVDVLLASSGSLRGVNYANDGTDFNKETGSNIWD